MTLVLLSRPIKHRNIFVFLTYNKLYCKTIVKTREGAHSFLFRVKNLASCAKQELSWIVDRSSFVKNIKNFRNLLFDLIFGWFVRFRTIGYHYTARLYYRRNLKKTGQAFVLFRLGFFYKVLIKLPASVKLYWRKRFFTLKGNNFHELFLLSNYIRFVRNLFPYKSKGFTFDNENFPLKTGKKSKFR